MMYRTKGKAVILAVAIAVSMVVMGILLNGMQERLQLESLDHEIRQEAAELPGVLQAATDETVGNEETFDAIYQSKAESVAFMARNDVGFETSDAKMREYKDLLKVDNIMVVARDGRVVAKAADTKATSSTTGSTPCGRRLIRARPPMRWRSSCPSGDGWSAITRARSTTIPWWSSRTAPPSCASLSMAPARPPACSRI